MIYLTCLALATVEPPNTFTCPSDWEFAALLSALFLSPILGAWIGRNRKGGIVLGAFLGLIIPFIGWLLVFLIPRPKPQAVLAATRDGFIQEMKDRAASRFTLLVLSAEVVKVMNRDETRVYSTGGTSSTHTTSNGNTYTTTSPVVVHSRQIRLDELWLRFEGGHERSIVVAREFVHCREGNHVRVAYLNDTMIALANMETGCTHWLYAKQNWRNIILNELNFGGTSALAIILLLILLLPVGLLVLICTFKSNKVAAQKTEDAWAIFGPKIDSLYATAASQLVQFKAAKAAPISS